MLKKDKDNMYVTVSNIYDGFYPFKDNEHKYYVSKKDFRNVISIWAELALEELIDKGETMFPAQVGILRIRKFKSKRMPIDWIKYRNTGVLEPIDNTHSDNYLIKISWLKRLKTSQWSLFKFKLTRIASAKASKAIKDNSELIYKYDTIIT